MRQTSLKPKLTLLRHIRFVSAHSLRATKTQPSGPKNLTHLQDKHSVVHLHHARFERKDAGRRVACTHQPEQNLHIRHPALTDRASGVASRRPLVSNLLCPGFGMGRIFCRLDDYFSSSATRFGCQAASTQFRPERISASGGQRNRKAFCIQRTLDAAQKINLVKLVP